MYKLLLLMLAFIILFFLSIFLLDIFYLSHRVSNVSQEEAKKTTLIYQGQEQRISFISRFDNVNLIYVRLKNPERKNTDDFYFQIKDQSNNILRQIDISGRNISDDDWIRFQFLPIKNIKDQKLNLSLNSATLDQNKAILVFTDNSDQLVYKVYSTDSWINVLRRELVNFYQRFTTDSLFVVSYIIINISIIIGYLILKKV